MPDRNYPPGDFANQYAQTHIDVLLIPPDRGRGFDDVFKLSRTCDCVFHNINVQAGQQRENALDINNESCRNTFTHLRLDAGGMNAILIKGGSCDNLFDDVLITRPGGHCDLYLGDYSDQSKKRTTGNTFNDIRRLDGQPIRVAWNLLRADKPKLTHSKVKYLYLLSFIRTCYVEAKYLLPKLVPCVAFVLLLSLAGCTAPTGRGSRLLPWNWFAPDHAAQLDQAQAQTSQAEDKLMKQAQIENEKTVEALKAAPTDNRAVQVASRTADNAKRLLDKSVGTVTIAEWNALHETVGQLLSENAALRNQGESTQAKAEKVQEALAADLAASRERETALTAKLQSSDRRYQAEAEKYRRVMFWVIAAGVAWLALQVLSGLSRFYPGLAPISHLAGMVAAPALQSAYNRVTSAAGRALADAEKVSQALADQIRGHLDDHTDATDQVAIRSQYQIAPRP